MSDDDDIKGVTSHNLTAWDQVAPIHARHNQAELIECFRRPGYSCLDDIETALLESLGVRGKDVAQVCCNNGREILSVKNMGAARCVGFDGAPEFIRQAQELAAAAGQDVEFVCTDIYDIDAAATGQFDLVTITIGVLGWMPEVERFFAILASLVKPGGAVFIYEQHPVLEMMRGGDAETPVEFEVSYFDKEPYVETDGLDYYGGEQYDAKPVTSYLHKMSDVIMAGVKAGLTLEQFEEHPHHISNFWYNVERADLGFPMSYTLVMRKQIAA